MLTPGSRKAVEERRVPPGTLLDDGRFRVVRFLGEGSFGTTYLVTQSGLFERPLVAKVLHRLVSDRARKLFAREARVLTELRHDAIPQVVSYFEHDGQPCIVQEYIEGETLAVRAARNGPMAEATVRDVLRQLCSVLAYLHVREPPIVHRDVKPDNLMINQDNKLFLIDFGAVHEFVAVGDPNGATVIGPSGGFSPHEVLSGRTVPASDMYMVGATGLFLLTGILPERFFDPVSAKRLDLSDAGLKASPSLIALLSELFNERVGDRPTATQTIARLDAANIPAIVGGPAPGGFVSRSERSGQAEPSGAVGTVLNLDAARAANHVAGSKWRYAAVAAATLGTVAGVTLWSRSRTDGTAPASAGQMNGPADRDSTEPKRALPTAVLRPPALEEATSAGLRVSLTIPGGWRADSGGPPHVLTLRDSTRATRVWVGADSVIRGREKEWVLSRMTPYLRAIGTPVVASVMGRTTASWSFWKVRFLAASGDTARTRGALGTTLLPDGATGWWFTTFESEADAATANTALATVRYVMP